MHNTSRTKSRKMRRTRSGSRAPRGDIMDLKTDADLIKALRDAARHQPTAEEVRAQRVSFIFSSIKESSGVTKARIEDVLAKQEGNVTHAR